jgi:hypothetical protein
VSGDLIVFYRTAVTRGRAVFESVVTTIGIVEEISDDIESAKKFIRLCKKRSVFSDQQLLEQWDYNKRSRPFIVYFLYAHSFIKRINLQRLMEIGVIADVGSVPRGFKLLTPRSFQLILKETKTDGRIIVD